MSRINVVTMSGRPSLFSQLDEERKQEFLACKEEIKNHINGDGDLWEVEEILRNHGFESDYLMEAIDQLF